MAPMAQTGTHAAAHRQRQRAPVWLDATIVVSGVAVAVMLLAGWLVKVDCIGPHYDPFGISTGFNARMHRDYCYSDIQFLRPYRGISGHLFPYLHGGMHNGQLTGSTLEYPVGTGLF